jgi:hypothetical protein
MQVIEKIEDKIRFAIGDLLFQQIALQHELEKRDQKIVDLEIELNKGKGTDEQSNG